MKKRGPLLAAFCIPLLITLIICVNREIYPFGDQCMLHIDMYHQYCPFFTELMEKLKTGGSPFYSWNIGLGADFEMCIRDRHSITAEADSDFLSPKIWWN